ncbi:cyclase family protein [Nocardioides sp. J9]|uniref:cyclase family protein n=1 Tax=Nocardioides sp. J9 TaxID=935844 RepID=UPI001C97B421|nr:cyclase family protein [Nocardioides sp. J9]
MSYDLSWPLGKDGPQDGRTRVNPVHTFQALHGDLQRPDGVSYADDYLVLPLQAGTQWDGLAHIAYDGRLYNDVPSADVTGRTGAARNGVHEVGSGMVGRGVLLDVARHHEVDWLPGGYTISASELDQVVAVQGVEIRPGDLVVVRTGKDRQARECGWSAWLDDEPGLGLDCAQWLWERDVAAVASDNWGIEALPSEAGYLPLHCVLIRDLGMMLGEIWRLESLSEACARDRRWDFFVSAPPLKVAGAVGAPTTPVVIR